MINPNISGNSLHTPMFDNANNIHPDQAGNLFFQSRRVFLRQSIDWLFAITDIQGQVEYVCYDASNPQPNQQQLPIFQIAENSSFIGRLCLTSALRPLTINVRYASLGPKSAPVIFIDKVCNWACLCFDRPRFFVSLNQNGVMQKIGEITYLFNCCDFNFNVYNAQNKVRFQVKGDCCQCGMCFPRCICEPCMKADFKVLDAEGREATMIKRHNTSAIMGTLARTDDFFVDFAEHMDLHDRALLVATVLMIDLMVFRVVHKRSDTSSNNIFQNTMRQGI